MIEQTIFVPDFHYPRYTAIVFPAYRYFPGINPHPTENPLGHSFGKKEEVAEKIDPRRWQDNQRWLYAVDLYNFAYWWESHEVLEGFWRAVPKTSVESGFFQGLIKVSAAFLKWASKERRGVQIHFESAMDLLGKAQRQETVFMGIDLKNHREKWQQHFQAVLIEPSTWPAPTKNYPFIILEGLKEYS